MFFTLKTVPTISLQEKHRISRGQAFVIDEAGEIERRFALELRHHRSSSALVSSSPSHARHWEAIRDSRMPAFGAHLHHLLMTARSAPLRVLALTLVAVLVFVFRYNVLTTFYIAQTYLTWYRFSSGVLTAKDNFDTTMASYPRNQTSAAPNYTDVVPPIIHHIVIGNIDLTKRPKWIAARDACLQWHPGYEYRFWNDSSAEELIRQEYPWFLDTWKSYTYPIQRADSLRYLVLYRYGGIFLDMDLHCRRALGPLRRFDFVSPAAYPVGISNGFLMASARHPFIKVLVEQLPLFNRNFLLPYATVMFSTGCMYISAQYSLYSDRCRLRLLDYKIHRLSGHVSTPLFDHEGSSSWHAGDASFIKRADHFLNRLFRHRSLVLMNFFVFVIVIAVVLHRRKSKSRDPLEKPLLTEKI